MSDKSSEYFDCTITPINAPDEGKTGVTFKGTNEEYIQAYTLIMDMFKKKGDRYIINGVEFAIIDNPSVRPYIIEVKQKSGISGKVKLKIFGVNKNGGGTIMVSKASGNDFVYAKLLAMKVITYLLEGIISKNIKHDDIVRMKKNNSVRSKKGVQCELCENNFANLQDLRLHVTRIHSKSNTEINCDTSNEVEKSEENIDTVEQMVVEEENERPHELENKSWEEIRFAFIKKAKDVMDTEEKEETDLEISYIKRTKLQDEKVLKKQRQIDLEDKVFKEKVLEAMEIDQETEKKRKRQVSTGKKKNKKKPKDNPKNILEKEKEKYAENIKEIDKKYESKFSEAGLDISEYVVCLVKGDGACGASCAALNFHADQNLGIYVRRNINQHIADFFPFYENVINFPLTQTAGNEKLPFKNKEEYLDFLQNDPRSARLWMEHYDLQALSNVYQVPIHILTTGLQGMEEPKARWTHLYPDVRLKNFSTEIGEIPELWLMHLDENHFDLIAPKSSIIVLGQDYKQENDVHKNVTNSEHEHTKERKKRTENKIVKQKEGEDHKEGPGYMGWSIDDTNENVNLNTKLEDLKIYFKQLEKNYNELKVEVDEVKEKLKKKEDKEDKTYKKFNKEINNLKEDYKECVKHLQNETFERNKAETMAKILRETLDAQNSMKNTLNHIVEEERMEIADEDVKENLKELQKRQKKVCQNILVEKVRIVKKYLTTPVWKENT